MSTLTLDFRNENTLWGSVITETLVRVGISQVVVSPGSRSTPLTMALAAHEGMETIPVLDERSAAFFALGLARQSGRPVGLVCTSGSAAANYLPAIVEASESGVPLLVLTADRPPEMRACASGQTIDQQKLYGDYGAFYHELAVPGATLELLSYLRQTVVHAAERTLLPQRGVVHLNVPFRDPLTPEENGTAAPMKAVINETFFAHLQPVDLVGMGQSKVWQRPTTTRGLIVAGPEMSRNPRRYAQIISELSVSLGWPILADGVSPLRNFPTKEAVVIGAYDTILRNEKRGRDLVPRYVLCLGSWPTSKVLRGWLEQSGAEIVLVTDRIDNRDCLHGRTRHMRVPVEMLATKPTKAPDGSYAKLWHEAHLKVMSALNEAQRPHTNFEGDIAPTLARALPAGTPMYVASSMAIRDLEYFWPVSDQGVLMYFNRGANGIDGTLSTALGVAHRNQPSVLLTGDLAFLHDSNGLLLRAKFVGSLTVVLINNSGGGIFEHLPVAQFEPPFEEYFATPQAVDFAKLCAAHQVEHIVVRDLGHLGELVTLLPSEGIRVLEVVTDRKRDATFRKTLFRQAADQLN